MKGLWRKLRGAVREALAVWWLKRNGILK